MTADVELLPLPETLRRSGFKSSAEAYARANVAHATAAKDAEIEALRAEVEAVWAAMPRDARYLDPPDGGCVPLHEQVRRMAADATRAERLAEALRPLAALDLTPDGFDKRPDDQIVYQRNSSTITVGDVRRAAAALRDHDKGESNAP